jgi:hypothetical protein
MEELWPSGVCLQGLASNRLERHWLKTVVVSIEEKSCCEHGRYGSGRRTTVNHREGVEILGDIKTGARLQLRDKSIGRLLTGWTVSGIEMARVRFRLFCGTAGTRDCDVKGDGQEKKIEAQSTDAQNGDGPTCNSVEEPVMGSEQRGRVDRLRSPPTRKGRSG